MVYTKFHSPWPIFYSPSLKCTRIGEWVSMVSVSFPHCYNELNHFVDENYLYFTSKFTEGSLLVSIDNKLTLPPDRLQAITRTCGKPDQWSHMASLGSWYNNPTLQFCMTPVDSKCIKGRQWFLQQLHHFDVYIQDLSLSSWLFIVGILGQVVSMGNQGDQ